MKHQTLLQVQVKNLPAEGLQVCGEVDAAVVDIADDGRVSVSWPFHLDVRVTRVVGGLMVDGTLSGALRCRCDRCLVYYTIELPSIPVNHSYIAFQDDILDLTEDVRDDILLAFPTRNLCTAACQGLCPECGQNLNVRECGCRAADRQESVWDSLNGLRLASDETPAAEENGDGSPEK